MERNVDQEIQLLQKEIKKKKDSQDTLRKKQTVHYQEGYRKTTRPGSRQYITACYGRCVLSSEATQISVLFRYRAVAVCQIEKETVQKIVGRFKKKILILSCTTYE